MELEQLIKFGILALVVVVLGVFASRNQPHSKPDGKSGKASEKATGNSAQ